MSYQEQLTREINEAINTQVAVGATLRAQWIAHVICTKHTDGLKKNEHSDFWRHGGYKTCRDEVRRCINRRIGDKEQQDDAQLLFEGHQHLQQYYVVRRNNEDVGIPANSMTDEEIETKITVYRNMGRACFAHARELQRFKDGRQAPGLFAKSA